MNTKHFQIAHMETLTNEKKNKNVRTIGKLSISSLYNSIASLIQSSKCKYLA